MKSGFAKLLSRSAQAEFAGAAGGIEDERRRLSFVGPEMTADGAGGVRLIVHNLCEGILDMSSLRTDVTDKVPIMGASPP